MEAVEAVEAVGMGALECMKIYECNHHVHWRLDGNSVERHKKGFYMEKKRIGKKMSANNKELLEKKTDME